MLTDRQRELLVFLEKCRDDDWCPSMEEMRVELGQASKAGVHRLVVALEERGFIRKLFDRERSIEVIRGSNGDQLITPKDLYYETALLREEVSTLRSANQSAGYKMEILKAEIRHLRRSFTNYPKATHPTKQSLSVSEVYDIIDSNLSHRSLALQYGVSATTIGTIKQNKGYKQCRA